MAKTPDRKTFAKKSLGQNFLSDPNFIRKIVGGLELGHGDRVLEIGPGRGALTKVLLEEGVVLTAIELDRDLIPLLHAEFDLTERFKLVEADALEVDFGALCGEEPVKLVANLPYYISTAILQRLIESHLCFSRLVLMLQKEVVERITAGADDAERGFLSVMVEAFFDSETLFDVPPTAFRPVPKVWSSVVRLIPKTEVSERARNPLFRKIVSAGFAQRRKTILNNLKSSGLFEDADQCASVLRLAAVDPARRAETLSLEEWLSVTGAALQVRG